MDKEEVMKQLNESWKKNAEQAETALKLKDEILKLKENIFELKTENNLSKNKVEQMEKDQSLSRSMQTNLNFSSLLSSTQSFATQMKINQMCHYFNH